MKTLLILSLFACSSLAVHADDQAKLFSDLAQSLNRVFNSSSATPEQIQSAQQKAIEGLMAASKSLQQKEALLATQTQMTGLASKGHDFSDGKSAAVQRAGKEGEYESLTLKNGTVYHGVKVLDSGRSTLKFSHDSGVATVSLLDVPEAMALKYIKP